MTMTQSRTASLLAFCAVNLVTAFAPAFSFTCRPTVCEKRTTTSRWFPKILLHATEQDDVSSSGSSDLSWMKDAMGVDADEPDPASSFQCFPRKEGISGFAVDPSLGFVAILAGNESPPSQRATYAVIAPRDTVRVSSAEALCMVQLSGGLDLGAAVLPPDTLAQLVGDDMDESPEELRTRVSLIRVDAIANEGAREDSTSDPSETDPSNVPKPSSRERDSAISESAEKVLAAVKKLPGLTESSLEQVTDAMKMHADESGVIDRQAFSEVLETLRNSRVDTEQSKVNFVLTVSVICNSGIIEKSITTSNAFQALALAMRYQVPVSVSEKYLSSDGDAFDASEILERFPAFRPIHELEEDAKVMDGFIPSQFFRATETLDNDQKI